MDFRLSLYFSLGYLIVLINAAAIDNSVYTEDEPRAINNGDQLISSIIDKCFHGNTMHCMKDNLLTYLNTISGYSGDVSSSQQRSFDEKNIDKAIVDRVGRLLETNEFHVQLPETLFGKSIITYRADRGVDFEIPPQKEEARGALKKKLLLPVLLLLKLKLKALLPIFVALIGLKAMKALIMSKIAITLVLGFLIYNLVQKLGGLKMSMMPMSMMPSEAPMTAYGPPSSTPASSYEPSSWDSSGGPYSRWDSTNSASAQNLAYSSYYPSSSSSSSSSSSLVSAPSSSSSSSYSYTS